jgi:hypothetical protein
MNHKKEYHPPAIDAENQLEQSSLSCTLIADPEDPEFQNRQPLAAGLECETDLGKPPAFSQQPFCESTDVKGVPLS